MTTFRLVLLTGGFYIAIGLLLQLAIVTIVWLKGEFLLYGTRWGFTLLFGLIWLLSFQLAWHIVSRPLHSGRL